MKQICNRCGNNEFDDMGEGFFQCTKCKMKINTMENRTVSCDDYHRYHNLGKKL